MKCVLIFRSLVYSIHFVSPGPAQSECRPLLPSLKSFAAVLVLSSCVSPLSPGQPERLPSGNQTYHSVLFSSKHIRNVRLMVSNSLITLNSSDTVIVNDFLTWSLAHVALRFWKCLYLQHLFPQILPLAGVVISVHRHIFYCKQVPWCS